MKKQKLLQGVAFTVIVLMLLSVMSISSFAASPTKAKKDLSYPFAKLVNWHIMIKSGYKAPTCTNEGFLYYTCILCGKRTSIKIAPLGHNKTVDIGFDATCDETGLTDGSHCSMCGKIIKPQEVIPALGHIETVDKGYLATCEESGLTDGCHCERCGKILIAQTIREPMGHKFRVVEKGYDSTCNYPGKTDKKCCLVCGKIFESEEIPVKDHCFAQDIIKASWEESGFVGCFCQECGLTDCDFDYEEIPMADEIVLKDNDGKICSSYEYLKEIPNVEVLDEYGNVIDESNYSYKITYDLECLLGKVAVKLDSDRYLDDIKIKTFKITGTNSSNISDLTSGKGIYVVSVSKGTSARSINVKIHTRNDISHYKIQVSPNISFNGVGVKSYDVVTSYNSSTYTQTLNNLPATITDNCYIRVCGVLPTGNVNTPWSSKVVYNLK